MPRYLLSPVASRLAASGFLHKWLVSLSTMIAISAPCKMSEEVKYDEVQPSSQVRYRGLRSCLRPWSISRIFLEVDPPFHFLPFLYYLLCIIIRRIAGKRGGTWRQGWEEWMTTRAKEIVFCRILLLSPLLLASFR